MGKSEDYLDQLLQGVSGDGKVETSTPELDGSFLLQEEEQSTIMSRNDSEKDFLEEFERELLAGDGDSDDFLKQFEKELNNTEDDFQMDNMSVDNMTMDNMTVDNISMDAEPVEMDSVMMDDIDGILNAAKSQMQGEDVSDNFDDMMVNTMDESFEGDEMESTLGDMLEGLGDMTAAVASDDFMQSADVMENTMESDFGSSMDTEPKDDDLMSLLGGENSSSDDDLMSLLGGENSSSDDNLMSLLGGENSSSDDDLMSLLNQEASFNGLEESIAATNTETDMEVEDPFAALAGMADNGSIGNLFGEDNISEDSISDESSAEESMLMEAAEEEEEKGRKGKKAKKEKKARKEKDEGEKEGFFAKLSKVLFGEDEEDAKGQDTVDPVLQTAGTAAIEELTDENLALLKELSGVADEKPAEPVETPEEKKKREKKEQKEKKAEERKAKKEQKAKEKKEKKANKPKKEKKPKPPKVPDNTPPLPKVPVFLIFVMAGSMFALVIIGTNLVGYSNSFANAESAYEHAEYVEAFAAVSGITVKEADLDTYEKYKVMAVVAGEYDGYENLMTAEFYDLALDSLVCTIGRYEKYKAEAETYGCISELNALEEKVENELKSTFGVSKDQAIELYSYEEREDYSLALYQILKETGYEKVTEE